MNMLNQLFNSRGKRIALLFLLTVILAGIVFYTRIGIRPKAAPGVPSLSFSLQPATVNAGTNFDLVLKVNPNNASFYAFELYVGYDPSKVEFQNTTNLSQNITSSYPLINSSVNTSTSTITVIGTRTGSPFTGSADQEIARVKMRVKSGASGNLVFSWGANTKLGSNITIQKVNGTFTIGGGGPAGGPVLSVDIPGAVNSTAQRGQNVDVKVFLNTNGAQIKATDVIIPYDDTRLTFQNVTDLAQNIEIDPNSGFDTQFVIKLVDTAAKEVIFALAAPTTPVQSNVDRLLATIKFVVRPDAPDGIVDLIPDPTSTVYDLQTQNILDCRGGYHLLVGQGTGATNTPTPPFGGTNTPTPPFGATNTPTLGIRTMTLNLKIKLQGILSRPNQSNTIPVRVSASSQGQAASQFMSTNFTVDPIGIWFGQGVFHGLPHAADYKIFIKGPKHLQKRICLAKPTESKPGEHFCTDGQINLLSGVSNFDFSGIFLLAGDLPPQDGFVNSYDLALVRNNIGKMDQTALAFADLNFDGIVDSQDFSLVIATLSIRSDDEL